MKVGFVFSQPFGHSIGTDVRVRGLLKGLVRLGVEIHVITPFAENISVDGENVFVHGLSSISSRLKISNLMYRLSKKFMTNPFLFKKVICRKSLLVRNACSLGRGVYKVASKLDLDVLQAEQQVASIACIRIGEKLRVPVVADFHGIWAEEMVASDVIDYDHACYRRLFELEREIACFPGPGSRQRFPLADYVESSFGASRHRGTKW